jgi:hypothetical protein
MGKAPVTKGMDRKNDTPSSGCNGRSMNGRRLAKRLMTFVVSQFDSNGIANPANELKSILVRAGDFVNVMSQRGKDPPNSLATVPGPD